MEIREETTVRELVEEIRKLYPEKYVYVTLGIDGVGVKFKKKISFYGKEREIIFLDTRGDTTEQMTEKGVEWLLKKS